MQLLEKEKVYEIFRRFNERNLEPLSELKWTNPFTLLVAVLLSAQATDIGVNKATSTLFKIANTPEEMLRLGEEKLKNIIKTINYYPTKAHRIILLSEILITRFSSQVPKDRKLLETLPGVGRKTANVV